MFFLRGQEVVCVRLVTLRFPCVVDASTPAADFMSYWPSIEAQLERDVSTLGCAGTVTALAMDEFIRKMRAVFREITASD